MRARPAPAISAPSAMDTPSPCPLPQWGRGLRRVGEAQPSLTRSWVRGTVSTSIAPECPEGGRVAILTIQILNSLLYASVLFLIAAGLSLIFGVMRIVNLAHGSLYAVG